MAKKGAKSGKKGGNPEDMKIEAERDRYFSKVMATEVRLAHTTESCEISGQAQRDLQASVENLSFDLEKKDKLLIQKSQNMKDAYIIMQDDL
jgi:hypothetical protein